MHAPLSFPHSTPPAEATLQEVAPGVMWLRMALPFALNHVNLYLIEDGAGWAILDTGVADDRSRAVWDHVLDHLPGRGKPTRLIVTHYHPDHAGLAGWLAARHDIPLYMPQTEYLMAGNTRHNEALRGRQAHQNFYANHGLGDAAIEALHSRGHAYLDLTSDLPPFYRLAAGGTLRIGGREFELMTGEGHAPEMLMLLHRGDRLFFPADQILAKISPNISVWPIEPHGNPLAQYLRDLGRLAAVVPADVLVLAAHNLPFRGLHQRIAELAHHHDLRCDDVVAAVATAPRTAAEILPALFPRALDAHQAGFAFGETLAHINHVVAAGRLVAQTDDSGLIRYAAG